jgi:hypothetical protein
MLSSTLDAMKFITESNKAFQFKSSGKTVVEKIRWSLRQRLRVQLQQLNVELFDEADDFLFAASKQSQFDKENAFLIAMRELRKKQSLFEEIFVTDILLRLKQSQFQASALESTLTSAELGAPFERIEIDLAFRSMGRKAEKLYSPHLKQIDSLNRRLCHLSSEDVISGSLLIQSSLHAFMHSQSCFTLPLDICLIFIKLFEQHFLLRMEKLFLDIISILTNASDDKFIERLYSSSSAFGSKKKLNQTSTEGLENRRAGLTLAADRVSSTVETAVADLVSQLCDSHRMPLFIERMLRTQWCAVMSVVGLNTGCESAQWKEAKYCALMLSAAASEGANIALKEKYLLLEQIEQGFKLYRVESPIQQKFLVQLSHMLGMDEGMATKVTKPNVRAAEHTEEASISPCGRRLLDQDDLSELAELLCGGEKTQHSHQASPQLDEYFSEVDRLVSGQQGRFKADTSYHDCRVLFADTGFYDIQFEDRRSKVKLSRLALAMALKQRDLMLDSLNVTQAVSSTSVVNQNLH